MANAVRKAIITTKVEGILTDLMVQTKADNVYVDDNTLLSAKLAEIITSLNSKASTSDLNTAIENLIGGAPETLDTLKEIADVMATNESVATAINEAITSKVDKVEGMGLSANDFTNELKAKLESVDVHSHANKSVLDGITAENINAWNGKTKVSIQATQPADMADGDVWVQLIAE